LISIRLVLLLVFVFVFSFLRLLWLLFLLAFLAIAIAIALSPGRRMGKVPRCGLGTEASAPATELVLYKNKYKRKEWDGRITNLTARRLNSPWAEAARMRGLGGLLMGPTGEVNRVT
jgi:hypothetical protein